MMKWIELLKVIGPVIVASTVPGGALLAPIIVHAIEAAEGLPGASGAEKKAHALELVEAGANGTNAVAGKVLIDPVLAASTAGHGIDAVVGAVNIAHQAHEAIVVRPVQVVQP